MRKYILMSIMLILLSVYVKINYFPPESTSARVQRVYHNVVAVSGMSHLALPVVYIDAPIVNAFNTGTNIVIFAGIINITKTDDELALVLAHELAHSVLQHQDLGQLQYTDPTVLEANADSLGGFYIMRAGYDICKARQLWVTLIESDGDYLGQNHPSISYRINQLNVGCK